MVVNMRVPFKAGVKDALSVVDPYKIKLMVNPDSSGLDEKDDLNKGNNLTGSLDQFKVSHFDLSLEVKDPMLDKTLTDSSFTFPSCNADKASNPICKFGLVNETTTLNIVVHARGSEGKEISPMGAFATASFTYDGKSVSVNIPSFTIGNTGTAQQTVSGVVSPSVARADNVITVKVTASGELDETSPIDNDGKSPKFGTYTRPVPTLTASIGLGVYIDLKGQCASDDPGRLLSGYWTYTAERTSDSVPPPGKDPGCNGGIFPNPPAAVNSTPINVNQSCNPPNFGNYHFTLNCVSQIGESSIANATTWNYLLKP